MNPRQMVVCFQYKDIWVEATVDLGGNQAPEVLELDASGRDGGELPTRIQDILCEMAIEKAYERHEALTRV